MSAPPGLTAQNKDAAPELLLSSGDVNMNNLFTEGDKKKKKTSGGDIESCAQKKGKKALSVATSKQKKR